MSPYAEAAPNNDLRYFKLSEFTDSEPPYDSKMNQSFLLKLDRLRALCGFPINIKSGYRSENHQDEKDKDKPGTHTRGIAVDIIAYNPRQRLSILKYAMQLGFTGIGIYPLHIHLDSRHGKQVIWVLDYYSINHARDSPRR